MNDPREHRAVKSVAGPRITYNCGCVNVIDIATSALKRMETCKGHRKQSISPEYLGQTYYEALHAIQDGIPQCPRYIGELMETLGEFPAANWSYALEIGPGASMYCPAILKKGYVYVAVEPSEWAAKWTEGAFDVKVYVGDFETFKFPVAFDLILAAHSLEHMVDAPGAIRKCADLLVSEGELWIVIPDDSDPVNPDHAWAFNMENLTHLLGDCGFDIVRSEVRKRVAHENFLYIRATKRT
jgi:SAM-dependent methyltransferase